MLKIFIIDAIRRLSILVTHHKTDHYEAASLVAVFILAVDVRTIEHWPITNPKDHSFFLSHQLLFLHLLIFLFFPFRGFVFFVSLFFGGWGVFWVWAGFGRNLDFLLRRLFRKLLTRRIRSPFIDYDEDSSEKTALSSLRRTQHGHNRTALFLLFFLSAKKKLLYHCFHSDKERKTKNYAKPFQKLNRPMLHFFVPRVHKIFRVELD